jgi:hypothetical protein
MRTTFVTFNRPAFYKLFPSGRQSGQNAEFECLQPRYLISFDTAQHHSYCEWTWVGRRHRLWAVLVSRKCPADWPFDKPSTLFLQRALLRRRQCRSGLHTGSLRERSREAVRSHQHAHTPDTLSEERRSEVCGEFAGAFRRGRHIDESLLRLAYLDAISNATCPPSLQTKHVEDRRMPLAAVIVSPTITELF